MSIRQITTAHLNFDMARCQACFRCVDICPKGVLGKVSLPFHKHVHIDHPEACIGCLRCVKICPADAIQPRREVE